MKLSEVVQQITTRDGEFTIYARHPWTPSSDAQIAVEGSEEQKKAKNEGLRYFLEISIAQEFLEDWKASQGRLPTDLQSVMRLIEYATNDV